MMLCLTKNKYHLKKTKTMFEFGNTSLQCFVNIDNLCLVLVCLRRQERDHVFYEEE